MLTISDYLFEQDIQKAIDTLSEVDLYIFFFYYNEIKNSKLGYLPDRIGSVNQHRFLLDSCKENKPLHNELEQLHRSTFSSKAKKMASMASQAAAAGKSTKLNHF